MQAVYGVLSAIDGCDAFVDLVVRTDIASWYDAVKTAVAVNAGERQSTENQLQEVAWLIPAWKWKVHYKLLIWSAHLAFRSHHAITHVYLWCLQSCWLGFVQNSAESILVTTCRAISPYWSWMFCEYVDSILKQRKRHSSLSRLHWLKMF